MHRVEGNYRRGRWLRRAAWSALALLFINTLGIFRPAMQIFSLDGSWIYAINQAVAERMAFGREVIFSYGPYAAVYTHAYHPGTVGILVFGSLIFGACYAFCFAWLARRARWPWPLLGATLLIAPLISPETYFSSLLLLIALAVYRLLDEKTSGPKATALALLLGCAGMLPLIKGSFAVMEAAVCLLSFLFLALRRRWTMAWICLLAPTAGMILFWVVIGQRIADLPGLFLGYLPIISGYSDAMSQMGSGWALWPFLLGALAILLTIVFVPQFKKEQKRFLLPVYSLYLLINFKEGFVRQDDSHMLCALSALAVGALLLSILPATNRSGLGMMLCLTICAVALAPMSVIWHSHSVETRPSQAETPQRIQDTQETQRLPGAAAGLFERVRDKLGLSPRQTGVMRGSWDFRPWRWEARFEEAQQQINTLSQLRSALPGTVDIYSYDQAALFARGYRWSPRPVFQSYSAYTPELARRNENHLRGAAAPDQILFNVETIDDRLPSLDDGLSWPALLDNYQLADDSGYWVHLTRKPGPLRAASRYKLLGRVNARLGEFVDLPQADGPVFAQIEIHPSVYGRLISIPYKLPELNLTVIAGNSQTATYRAIAGMMEAGFFLSPLIEENHGFTRLFNPSAQWKDAEKVQRIRLDSDGRGWNGTYRVTFKQYEY